MTVLGAVNEWYRDNFGAEVSKGLWARAEGVRPAFQTYPTGVHSCRDVAQVLNEARYRLRGRGDPALRQFNRDSVDILLKN